MTADLPQTPVEALLAEREWVRALARSLVADVNQADDIEQQTWLAAATRPPGDLSAPRAWLGTVLRNFVRLGARRDSRRRIREAAVARSVSMPSADEMVARAETHRRVVEAVLALPEPYRTAILARFFEEMPPREIARRLGVPVETVRTRIKRGLAELRARLDAQCGGDGRSWGIALLPLAWKGGVIVQGTTKSGIAVAAVLLLAGAIGVWTVASRSGDAEVASGTGRETATAAPAQAAHVSRAAMPQEPETSDIPAQGRSAVHGEVWSVSPDAPVPGVDVAIGPPGATRTVRTDDAGRFRLDGLNTAFRGSVRARRRESCEAVRALAPLREGEDRDVGILHLTAPATADVRVVSFDGRPVEGAEVEAWRTPARSAIDAHADAASQRDAAEPAAHGRTDAAGQVRLAGLEPGTWTFGARRAGFVAAASRPRPLVAGRVTSPIRIDLERGSPLAGRVIDREGNGLPGVLVWAEEQPVLGWNTVHEAIPHATSSADGSFAFDALRQGTYELRVQRVPAPLVTAATVRIPASAPVDVVLAGRLVVGTVRDAATGAAVAGALVKGCAGGLFNCIETMTDVDGHYTLDTVIDTQVVCPLTATKPGYVNVPDPAKLKNPGIAPAWWLNAQGDTTVDLVLRRAAKLAGRVTVDGEAVREASVLGQRQGAPMLVATTDSDGRFAWDGIEQGRLLVQVIAPGLAQKGWDSGTFSSFWSGGSPPGSVAIPETGEVTIEVVMERGAEVSGRVVGADGAPVAGATLTVGTADEQVCGDDGTFHVVAAKVNGRVFVHAQHPDVGWGSLDAEWPASGALADVEIKLTPFARLRVNVTAADDILRGAWIQFAAPQESPLQQQDWTTPRRFPIGAGGACDVSASYPSERLLVRAGAPGFASAVVEAAKSADGAWTAEIRLERAVRLAGRAVVDSTGEPCAGAEVMIEPPQRTTTSYSCTAPYHGVVAAVADADGRFVVDGLAPGAVFVRVQAEGRVAAEATVTLPATGEVEFVLARGGEISGVVTYSDGSPCTKGRASAYTSVDDAAYLDGKRRQWFSSATTDAEGRFTIRSLPEGTYEVSVGPAGLEETFANVVRSDVTTGTSNLAFTVERQREGLALRGRVVGADGSPVVGASVSARPASGEAYGNSTTRADGAFEIDGLEAVEYLVTASPPQPIFFWDIHVSYGAKWLGATLDHVRAPRDDVVVTLPLGETIEGILVDASGAPLRSHWVALGAPSRDAASRWINVPGSETDQNGRFAITGLRPGGHWRLVEAGFPGVRDAAPLVGGEDVAAGTRGLRFSLGAFAKIKGRVVDESGGAVVGAKVSAFGPRGAERSGAIDTTGAFEIANLDAGAQLDVVAWAEGFAPTTVRAVTSGAEGVRIVLVPGRRVTGRVLDKDGKPLALTKIVLRTSSSPVPVETATDRDGRFTATGVLAAARYRAAFVALRDHAFREISCGMIEAGAAEVLLRSEE